jgi:CRISPR/Cas system-associated exonuclease Cas4 (RecB family)
MTTTARRTPYLWVTWITGLLSGDNQCGWAAWFKAHFQYEKLPRDVDLSAWKADHAELVRATRAEQEEEGAKVLTEEQVAFKLKGLTVTLAGQADVVSLSNGRAHVIDCKTGKPKDGDLWQVLLYMLALPMAVPILKGKLLSGEIRYRIDHVPVPAEMLDTEARRRILRAIKEAGGDEPPPRRPSSAECRFCDISKANCPDRIDDEDAAQETEWF